MDKKLFQGSGGGGPTTTPDSLLSEDIVEVALALSEGPIRGLANGAYSFYVGDTPLVGPDGTRNFDKFAIGVHPGYPEGSAAPLNLKLGGVSSNINVGVRLLKDTAVTRTTEAQLRGSINSLEVRLLVNRLLNAGDDGSTSLNTARFKIEYKPASSGTWKLFEPFRYEEVINLPNDFFREDMTRPIQATEQSEMSLRGKTSGGYAAEFKVDVPTLDNDDWTIRVTKLSKDNDEHDIVDLTWESFQAVTLGSATFPDTAVVHAIGVANGQFSNIPDFSGVYDGLLVRVPTNYNPDTRTYSESTPWNGSFKFAWTNNPAWILYDLIVNTRYGLAKHRRYIDANRFSFYEAAKWCDAPVSVQNSTETRPRFTFNMVMSEVRPGMEMLNYVAGSFNALVWDDLQGQIHLRVDKDDPAVMVFTPENVLDEGFNYSYTDITARANDISVAFVNPDLDWNEDRRRIPNVTTNEEHIQKHGRIPLDFIAVGCTNLHEAIAKAQVRLISAQTETTMVSFTTTRLGALLSLYDVILIADPMMGWSQTGRLTTYDDQWVNFRDPVYIETIGTYVMKLQTALGMIAINVTPESTGPVTRLRVQGEIPANLPRYTVFTLEGLENDFGYAKPFRVMSITEADDSPYMFTISAVEINRSKYIQAEGEPTDIGNEFDYSVKVPFLPGAPTSFHAESGDEQILIMPTGEVVARILASWQKPYGSVTKGYVLQYRLTTDGDTNWQTIQSTSTSEFITPVVPGQHYKLRVAAVDGNGKQSDWVTIDDHLAKGKSKIPKPVQSITATGGVFQITLNWDFGVGAAPDLSMVELWKGTTNNQAQATKLADLAYPTNSFVHVGLDLNVTLYYWVRVKDTQGNYSLWTGPASASTSRDPAQILGLLEGKITSSQLYQDLGKRIDLIDAPASTIGSVAARLLDEQKARDAAIKSSVDVITDPNGTMVTQINSAATKAGQALSAVSDEVTNRTTAISAEVTARNEALTSFGNSARTEWQNYSYSKSAADSSIGQVYTTLRSEYGSADANTLSSAKSYVQSYAYTKAEADNSASYYANQVGARLNNIGGTTIEQAFSSQANAITGLNSQYTVKIDSGGRVVGFGLASKVSNNGVADSSFIIRADTFAIAYPGVNSQIPFMVGTVNGVSVVGINGAVIIQGTLRVGSADIDDAAIGTLKVAGNAITGLSAATGSGGIPASGSTTLAYASVSMPSGASGVVVSGSASLYCANNASVTLIIYKNGSQIGSTGVSLMGGFHGTAAYTCVDSNPTVGSATYSLGFSNPGSGTPGGNQSVSVDSCSLVVSGAKR